MFSSFGRSWQLVKASWAVLQSDKELVIFPIVSAITMIAVSIIFLLPVAAVLGFFSFSIGGDVGEFIGYAMLFIYYLVAYTIGVYFNVALIGAAMIRLDGGDPTLSDGFRIANERLTTIIGYAAISATVGMILNWLRDRGILGQIASSLVGLAWNLATFLAVPILVAQDVGPIEAVKRSASLLKQTWGEQITGGFSMSLIFTVIYLAVIFGGGCLLFGLAAAMESSLIAGLALLIIIIAVAVVATIHGALGGIFQAALYRFAETGVAPDNFDIDLIKGAFKPKRKR